MGTGSFVVRSDCEKRKTCVQTHMRCYGPFRQTKNFSTWQLLMADRLVIECTIPEGSNSKNVSSCVPVANHASSIPSHQ